MKNKYFLFLSFQPIDDPLATSTPKPTKGKGVKGATDKGKDKAKVNLNIVWLDDSDDDFCSPKKTISRRPPISYKETVFFNHLRLQGVPDDLLESET